MLKVIINSRTLRAVGSVIDLQPQGDYSEHMPKGQQATRIASHWKATGSYLRSAIERYDEGQAGRGAVVEK